MPVDNLSNATASEADRQTLLAAERLLEAASWASLGTLAQDSGGPFVSLVQVAAEPTSRAPLVLISRLAVHTQNLLADPRASLLIDQRQAAGASAAAERVTLVGRMRQTGSGAAMAAYLALHPAAQAFASFADFGLWTLDVERAHLVAGFGRIASVAWPRQPGAGG